MVLTVEGGVVTRTTPAEIIARAWDIHRQRERLTVSLTTGEPIVDHFVVDDSWLSTQDVVRAGSPTKGTP